MIYFIRSGEFVKIGHCVRDPIRRLEKLQIGNPITLELVALTDGGRADEAGFHDRFRKDHVRGEWFRLSAALRREVRRYRVSHQVLSEERPVRKVEGVPAWQIEAYIQRAAATEIERLNGGTNA